MNTLEPGKTDALSDRTTPLRIRSSNDDVTDRQLMLLIGLVVVVALGAFGLAVWHTAATGPGLPNPVLLLLIYALSVIAYYVKIDVRIHSSRNGSTWTELPI